MSGLGCKTPNLKIKIMVDSSLFNTCKINIKISFQTNLKVNAYGQMWISKFRTKINILIFDDF